MNKRMWFTKKRYGWGWVPITWEGWTSIALLGAFVIYSETQMQSGLISQTGFILRFVLAVGLLIVIGYVKGPKAKWQWGKK